MDPRVDEIVGVMENPHYIPEDKGTCCDMDNEALIPDMVIRWWNKEKCGPTMDVTSLSMGPKGSIKGALKGCKGIYSITRTLIVVVGTE